jgi:hypothetical protein
MRKELFIGLSFVFLDFLPYNIKILRMVLVQLGVKAHVFDYFKIHKAFE